MYIVRITMDATWYPNSDSTAYHARVIKLNTAGAPDVPTECYDRHVEILHGGGDPVLLVKHRLVEALGAWCKAIGSFEPF
jgi:hypothetical protein